MNAVKSHSWERVGLASETRETTPWAGLPQACCKCHALAKGAKHTAPQLDMRSRTQDCTVLPAESCLCPSSRGC